MILDDLMFNSNNDPLNSIDYMPAVKKILPFPLENIEEDLGDIYFNLDNVRKRIEVAKRSNVTNSTEARVRKIKRMQYKINTAMSLIRKVVLDLDDLWVN